MTLYEEKNPSDISIEVVYDSIKSFLSNIKLKDIYFLYHGTYNVYEVVTSHGDPDRYIFRFPDRHFRNIRGVEMINKEIESLKLLHEELSVLIPNPLFYSDDPTNPFVGYKKIPGVSLSSILIQLTEVDKENVAKQIAFILKKLHSQDMVQRFQSQSSAKIVEYRTPETIQFELESLYTELQDIVYPEITVDQQKWLKRLFEMFLNDERHFNFVPRLTHGDFDSSNILIDPKTKRLTGIIDFEEIGFNDPAVDLLFFREGSRFLHSILEIYGKNKQALFSRMKFYFSKSCVHYLLFGIKHKRSSLIQEGLNMLKHRMNLFPL